jgi:hypothetical protein
MWWRAAYLLQEEQYLFVYFQDSASGLEKHTALLMATKGENPTSQ